MYLKFYEKLLQNEILLSYNGNNLLFFVIFAADFYLNVSDRASVFQIIIIIYNKMSDEIKEVLPNRLKAVLAEHNRTSRWLAQELGKGESTVSRWCSNKKQPSVIQLQEIAKILDVDVRTLLTSTKE